MSAPQFAIGEIAIFWHPGSLGHLNEVEVVSPLAMRRSRAWGLANCYRVSGQLHGGRPALARPQELRKKPQPGDESRDTTTWDKCIWQPKQVAA